MRTLISGDLFAALRLVREIGIKEEMRRFAALLGDREKNDKEGKNISLEKLKEELGMELIFGILANCGTPAVEKAFYNFLEGPMEIQAEELREMDLLEFGHKVMEMVAMNDLEHWRAFFTSLAGLMKKLKS